MKKWVVTASAVIALAALAATARRWLPPFLSFLGANSDRIQALSDFVQLVLWGGAGALAILSLWRRRKADALPPTDVKTLINSTTVGASATTGGVVRDSKFATGGGIASDRLEVGRDLIKDSTVHIHHAAATLGAALHQLPSPPADFTGRAAELAELTSAVEQGGVQISGLRGMGGIGKTALALKLAQQLTPRFPDAQFYLDLKGARQPGQQPLTAAEALAHVVRAYHPTAKLPDDENELRALYLSVLHGQRALLVMDNAADRAQVEPLIPPPPCALIVTSRQHFTLPGLRARDLDTLPPSDAEQLLLAIAPDIGQHAADLARLCGYLPLALRLAASALAERPDLTPADYLRRLADTQRRLKVLDEVEISLTLSYDLLTPNLQKLWRTLAVFPATFDKQAAAAVWQLDADAAHDALGHLLKYSLLDWDEEIARYRLHDLARLFADDRLGESDRYTAQKLHAGHYLAVCWAADALYKQGHEAFMQALALFDSEWPNIQTGQAWSTAHAREDNEAASLCSQYPSIGVYLLYLRQRPCERISWLESALTAARQLKDRAAESDALGNLGLAYADLGEALRAIEFYEQHLIIARELGDRYGEAADFGNLGNAYAKLGETHRAIELFEQQLSIAKEIGYRRAESNAINSLGTAYAQLGETRRAMEFYEQRLVIVRELGDIRNESTTLFNMGVTLDELGARDEAISYLEAALEIRERIGDPRAGKVRALLAWWRGEVEGG
ncbi:MAG TPA: tetratricopeptide repeat protein [Pyrinomonadaceae bacterium]|nr:tetratricopeptide repeat protein [Pyrinomonadaceae bacterium]